MLVDDGDGNMGKECFDPTEDKGRDENHHRGRKYVGDMSVPCSGVTSQNFWGWR